MKLSFILSALIAASFFPNTARASWTLDSQQATNITCETGFSGSSPSCGSTAGHCAAVGVLIIIQVNYYQSSGTQTGTASNTNGYTWATRVDTATAANNYRTLIFDTVSTGSSCDTFSVTMSGTVSFGFMVVVQATSSTGSAAFDATCSPTPSCWTFNSNANPQVASSLTTSQSGDLLIGNFLCAEGFNGWGVGTGYTAIFASGSNALFEEFKVAGGAGTENVSASNSTTCSFGTSIGNATPLAYRTAAGAGSVVPQPWVIIARYQKNTIFPFDDRRKKLEITLEAHS